MFHWLILDEYKMFPNIFKTRFELLNIIIISLWDSTVIQQFHSIGLINRQEVKEKTNFYFISHTHW